MEKFDINKDYIFCAIDPSGHANGSTGFVWCDFINKQIHNINFNTYKKPSYWTLNEYARIGFMYILNEIKKLKALTNKDYFYIFIIEDYLDRGIVMDNSTKELIGIWKKEIGYAFAEGTYKIIIQQPAVKACWTVSRLKKLNVILKENKLSTHSIDATKHLIYFLNKEFFNRRTNFKKLFYRNE